MMTRIPEIVREMLGDRIAGCAVLPEQMTSAMSLVDDLGMNSLERFEISIALEEVFDFEVSDEDMETAKTVGDLIALVERLHEPQGGDA